MNYYSSSLDFVWLKLVCFALVPLWHSPRLVFILWANFLSNTGELSGSSGVWARHTLTLQRPTCLIKKQLEEQNACWSEAMHPKRSLTPWPISLQKPEQNSACWVDGQGGQKGFYGQEVGESYRVGIEGSHWLQTITYHTIWLTFPNLCQSLQLAFLVVWKHHYSSAQAKSPGENTVRPAGLLSGG